MVYLIMIRFRIRFVCIHIKRVRYYQLENPFVIPSWFVCRIILVLSREETRCFCCFVRVGILDFQRQDKNIFSIQKKKKRKNFIFEERVKISFLRRKWTLHSKSFEGKLKTSIINFRGKLITLFLKKKIFSFSKRKIKTLFLNFRREIKNYF